MINKLIVLADKLDKNSAKEAADVIDYLLSKIAENDEDTVLDWDQGEITKVRPFEPSLPTWDPNMLEHSPGIDAATQLKIAPGVSPLLGISGQIKHVLERGGNPALWSPEMRKKVHTLMEEFLKLL